MIVTNAAAPAAALIVLSHPDRYQIHLVHGGHKIDCGMNPDRIPQIYKFVQTNAV
jgi:DNA integrity scanning protein DisA with diadenylate cyclase activity